MRSMPPAPLLPPVECGGAGRSVRETAQAPGRAVAYCAELPCGRLVAAGSAHLCTRCGAAFCARHLTAEERGSRCGGCDGTP